MAHKNAPPPWPFPTIDNCLCLTLTNPIGMLTAAASTDHGYRVEWVGVDRAFTLKEA